MVVGRIGARLAYRATACLLGLLLAACGKQGPVEEKPAEVLAMVGSQGITPETFRDELARRGRLAPERYADSTGKAAVLEELIRSEAVYQRALAEGYHNDPQVVTRLKQMIAARYQEDQMAKQPHVGVTKEEIADYYDRNLDRFGKPAKSRVAMVELKVARTASAEKRAEVRQAMELLRSQIVEARSAEEVFARIARDHSEHQASRYRGGDIGWLSAGEIPGGWEAAMVEAALRLEQAGEISPVVETPTAFYLVRLTERHPASVRPLEEVREGIEYLITRQKEQTAIEVFFAEQKRGLHIWTNQALLESIQALEGDHPPPALPGGSTAQTSNQYQR